MVTEVDINNIVVELVETVTERTVVTMLLVLVVVMFVVMDVLISWVTPEKTVVVVSLVTVT